VNSFLAFLGRYFLSVAVLSKFIASIDSFIIA